jgi:hypothetical protein
VERHFMVVFDDGILADPVERGHAGEILGCGVKCGWRVVYFSKWGGTNTGAGSEFLIFQVARGLAGRCGMTLVCNGLNFNTFIRQERSGC